MTLQQRVLAEVQAAFVASIWHTVVVHNVYAHKQADDIKSRCMIQLAQHNVPWPSQICKRQSATCCNCLQNDEYYMPCRDVHEKDVFQAHPAHYQLSKPQLDVSKPHKFWLSTSVALGCLLTEGYRHTWVWQL